MFNFILSVNTRTVAAGEHWERSENEVGNWRFQGLLYNVMGLTMVFWNITCFYTHSNVCKTMPKDLWICTNGII